MEIEQILRELTSRDLLESSLMAEKSFWFAPGDVVIEDGDIYAYVRVGSTIYRAWFVISGQDATYMSMDN